MTAVIMIEMTTHVSAAPIHRPEKEFIIVVANEFGVEPKYRIRSLRRGSTAHRFSLQIADPLAIEAPARRP